MTERLAVRIPLNSPHHDIDADDVEELILQHQSEFYPLFERTIDVDDARVQLVDDSIEVRQVDFDDSGTSGTAEVEFMSSFYAGCKDLNSDDWHTENLPFQIIDGALLFDIDIPAQWRVDN